MKKILLPTDFSENAEDALIYAAKFVGATPAEINLFHVVPPNLTHSNTIAFESDSMAFKIENGHKAMTELLKFADLFNLDNKESKIKFVSSIRSGSVVSNIKEEVNNYQPDLIIMGNQGKNHTRLDRFFGTAATEVLAAVDCPILFVPLSYDFKIIDNIIFPTDLNHEDPYELWRAIELMRPNVPIIRSVYVGKNKEDLKSEELKKFSRYMVEHSPSIQTHFHTEISKDIHTMVAEYAENYDAEMIVMHTSKKTLLEKMFSTGNTKKILSKVEIPLLVMNYHEKKHVG